MSAADRRRLSSLDELRALQRQERAPAALRRRVLERLAGEPASAAALAAPRSSRHPLAAARRVVPLQPGGLALGALAAALLFALSQWLPPPRSREPELTLAPEPSEPAASAFQPGAGTAAPQPGAVSTDAERTRALAGAAAARAPVSAAAAARRWAAPQPRPAPSRIGQPAPDLQPGLRRDRPARGMVMPGFATTGRALMSEGPLPAGLGPNLITNGDFSQGTALWSVRRWDDFVAAAPTELAPYDVVQGALCTTLRSGAFVMGGWPWGDRSLSPNSFALERGQRYRVSLRAWIKGPLQVALVFKVGHQEQPYDAAIVAAVPVTQSPRLFSIAFEPHADDDNAGVGFVANAIASPATAFGSSDLCIDDVKLTREARPL